MKSWQQLLGIVILCIILSDPALKLWDRIHGEPTQETPIINININKDISSDITYTSKNLSNESLKKQTKELANNISAFIGDSDIKEKLMISNFSVKRSDPNNLNLDEEYAQWHKDNNKIDIFQAETVKTFNEIYLGDVIRIKNEFQKRNITNKELEVFLRRQYYYDLRNIPSILYEMSNKLQ